MMDQSAGDLARLWLEKAHHDLATARAVLELRDGPTDTPCFHAQQAVEKALKGFLTARGVRFGKVHDVMVHFESCLKYLPELGPYRRRIAELADYAVAVRYPVADTDPDREDAVRASDTASEIVEIVQRALSGAD